MILGTQNHLSLPNTPTSRNYTYMYMVPNFWPPLFSPAVMLSWGRVHVHAFMYHIQGT